MVGGLRGSLSLEGKVVKVLSKRLDMLRSLLLLIILLVIVVGLTLVGRYWVLLNKLRFLPVLLNLADVLAAVLGIKCLGWSALSRVKLLDRALSIARLRERLDRAGVILLASRLLLGRVVTVRAGLSTVVKVLLLRFLCFRFGVVLGSSLLRSVMATIVVVLGVGSGCIVLRFGLKRPQRSLGSGDVVTLLLKVDFILFSSAARLLVAGGTVLGGAWGFLVVGGVGLALRV